MTDYIVEDLWEFGIAQTDAIIAPAAIPSTAFTVPHLQHPPFLRIRATSALLRRSRLSLALVEGDLPPLSLVEAPSGFGKSSLLTQWQSELTTHGIPVLHLAIHTTHAIAQYGNSGRSSVAIGDHQRILQFIREWLDTRIRAAVLIDDGHLLPNDVAQALCAFFLQTELQGHSLTITSRHRLGVPLARARSQGLVHQLGARDLCFSDDEFRQLIDRELHVATADATLAEILKMTGGWPVAVAAAIHRISDIGSAAVFREFKRGSSLMDDFFDEEVLHQISENLRNFLIDSSMLGVLTADACDAALGIADSADLLDQAISAGLFIEPIDGRRAEYRLQPLFTQYLRSKLIRKGRDRHRDIALRGAAWFEHHDRLADAFNCAASAEAWDAAALLLDQHGMSACLSGSGPLVTAMALRLPQDVLRKYPRAAVFAARGASSDWRFGLVEDFLQLAHTAATTDTSSEVESLVLHSRMLTAQYEDDQIEAGRRCLELLKRADDLDHYTRGTIFGSLLYARREQFDFTEAAELEAAAVREFNLGERSVGMVWHLSVVGPTHALRGDLTTAARRLEEATAAAIRLPDAERVAPVPALLLAEVYYERNEIAQSHALVDRHHPAPLIGFIDQYVAGYTIGAKLLWLAGHIEAAHRMLDAGMALAENRALERLRQAMIGERIRLLLACSQQQRAFDIGQQENLSCSADHVLPGSQCTSRDEIRAVSWFRLALARGELAQAIDVAHAWKRFMTKAGAIRSVMRWEIQLAMAYAALGQTARAQRELRHALDRAIASGYVRSFIDEGDAIRRLLQEQQEASSIHVGATDDFVARLLQAWTNDRSSAASTINEEEDDAPHRGTVHLTKTQIEILQMASAGLQNGEIARRIGMTEGSVKWYMQQIFNKIGVRKRAGALDRARSLGLMA